MGLTRAIDVHIQELVRLDVRAGDRDRIGDALEHDDKAYALHTDMVEEMS